MTGKYGNFRSNEIFSARKTANFGRSEILEQRVEQLKTVVGMEALKGAKLILLSPTWTN